METKLKFKVGDKVRVKSLEWYKENKNFNGNVYDEKSTGVFFSEDMSKLCGEIVQITRINEDSYHILGNKLYWQDWMFEDEAVTEERQEMTQEEIFAYLDGAKIICLSTQETINVQKKLFELGIEWEKGKEIDELKFLLIIEGKLLKYTLDIDYWVRSIRYKQIAPSEILAIKLKEEEGQRFDPKSLQPFDEVLVKNDTIWFARFFDMCREGGYQTTSGEFWIDCIPYNEETRHLHGNANKAPKYYQVWKK